MANALQERHTAPALENVRREFDELMTGFSEEHRVRCSASMRC
jgi:hypothetical protein